MLQQVLQGQEQLRAGQEQLRRELKADIVALQREVRDYHGAVVGHGIEISGLETRMRRVEDHLDLPPLDPR